MTSPHFGTALRRWLHGLSSPTRDDASDGELLEQFVHQRDESAFAGLVRRHGPLVLGVCGRLVADEHDADDVFQATFLVLACRAAAIRRRQSVASFLYGTALRLARHLHVQNARQGVLHRSAAQQRPEATMPNDDDRETHAVLHEELNRLSPKHRDVLILCYLQDKTHEQAARELGYPPGSMSRHLNRARELLRERLLTRGVSAVLVAALAGSSRAAVSSMLLYETMATVRRHVLASSLLSGSTPPAAVMLAQGVLRAAWLTRAMIASLVLSMGIAFAGGMAALQSPTAKAPADNENKLATPTIDPKPEPQPRRDLYGDPLPDGVLARMGTIRLRHPNSIRLHFAADGKTLISVGQDQTVRFWDLATGKLQRLQRLPSGQRAMALSASGKTVALTSTEHLHLWDIAAAKEIQRIATGKLDNEKQLKWVEFSPDGKTLAACNYDSTVLLWDAAGKERARYKHKDSYPFNLVFSPDGKMLAAIGDHHIVLWDVASGKELRAIKGKNVYYARLAFSPDGKLLMESSHDAIRIWDVATGKGLAQLQIRDSDKKRFIANYHFAVAPDGKTIVAGLGDYVVFWDLTTRKEVKRLEVSTSGVWQGADWIAFSPDGKRLASVTSGKISVWDIVNDKQLHEQPSHVYHADSVAISPDGKYVASACGGDRTVRLWDAHSGKQLHVWLAPHRRIFPVLFTPDSANVIAAANSVSGDIRMWNIVSGEERQIYRVPDLPKDAADMILAVRLSQDSKRLTAISLRIETKDKISFRKRYLTTWDVVSGKRIERRPLAADDKTLMHTESLSPNGKYATFFRGRNVIIFDLLNDRPWRTLSAAVWGPIAFSPDSRLLAYTEQLAGKIQRLRLCDLASRADVLTLETGHVELRGFSPDGRYVLTVGDPGMRLWELASGKEVLHYTSLISLNYFNSCLTVAADGRSAAVGMPDTNILVWDLAPATRQKYKLSAADLERLWRDLAGGDAACAYRAVGTLIADPEHAVSFLRDRLQPVKADAPRIRRLIADLASDQFPVRDAAFQALEKMDDAAHSVLRQELPKVTSLEQRRRIQALLSVPWLVQSPQKLRQIRAVMVLEQIGDVAARRLLEHLSEGASDARQSREAKEALRRLRTAIPSRARSAAE